MITFNNLPDNLEIYESFVVMRNKLIPVNGKDVMCSISGGSDSDIMIDLVLRVAKEMEKDKIHFVFFDTGLEYKATKDHLKFLEDKYDIKIEVCRPKVPIPMACRKHGQPFISKQVSEWISRLQRHNFQWEDESFETLIKRYPKCKAALKWWCNKWTEGSKFNISYNKFLKEFMIENPPQFKISNKCCQLVKKNVAKKYIEENFIELSLIGIRKAEGGARSTFQNCFSPRKTPFGTDEYRPLFWYKDNTKCEYEKFFGVTHSRCYTEYGLKRTGCAGCPFGRDFENELEIIKKHEPKLFSAVNKIFGDSYEYTRQYKEFVKNAKRIRF